MVWIADAHRDDGKRFVESSLLHRAEEGLIYPFDMTLDKLPEILKEHQLWLSSGGKEGKRAVLTGATLNDADFGEANLTDADFQRAELRRANFGKARMRRTNLRETDLQNANLEETNFLLSAQIAGADVAGAKLPEAIADFEGLKIIAEATSNAQKVFIAMLGGCLYCWLTTGTTKDAALLTNSASSPLPVIGTALPIVGFYLVAPVVLVALYFYFHLNMQRLWEALADLPAVFPDGRPLDKVADPWLLNGFVRAHFFRLRDERPPLSRMQQWLSILLAWCAVPVTLFVFWGRYLLRHHLLGTLLHVGLLAASIGGGWTFYRLARATLRGAPRKPFVWGDARKDGRIYKRIAGVSGACLFGVIFYLVSAKVIEGGGWGTLGFWRLAAGSLQEIGFRPFADLGRQDVSTKPSNWTGDVKEYPLVKSANLPQANMQYANAYLAFLVNADMRQADLSKANLSEANLWNADLSDAKLLNADLSNAHLSKANLSNAHLSGADLSKADLSDANLPNAHLSNANLSGADLSKAKLWSADLSDANLSEADLSEAELDGANLSGADLSKADLLKTKLSLADLSRAKLWNADLSDAKLSNADLSEAELYAANLSGADLTAARLSKTKLSGADLSKAKLWNGSTFSDAKLSHADLSGADLYGANLSGADLTAAPANLSGADPATKLSKANLSEANLDKASLTGVDLRNTEGLTKSQLKKAKTDGYTLLPADLPP